MAKIMMYLRLVTVEPVMFLYMLGSFLQYTSVQHLLYKKTCLQLFNSAICGNLTHYGDEEKHVQTQTSHWLIYLNLVQTIPSILVALFLGAWSDKVGRKISMMLPCLASVINATILIISSVYILMPIPVIFIGTFLLGCSGGYISITFTVFSYMADITDMKNRTRRVGFLESMTFLGSTIGLLCGGIMIENVGFVSVFILYGSLNLMAFLYIISWLQESVKITKESSSSPIATSTQHVQSNDQISLTDAGGRGLCSELCQLDNIKKSLSVCLKTRPNSGRLHLILLATILLLFQLVGSGDSDVTVLYTKKEPLSWTPDLLGYYLALNSFLKGLCLVTVLPFLTYKTTFHDTTVAMIGTLFRMGAYILIAFSTETWMMFIVPILMCLAGIPAASVRSLISKVVNADEQGSLFSFMAACESLVAFLASFIFNSLYPATLSILNGGFVYIVMASLLVIALILLFWVGDSMRHINSYLRLSEEGPEQTGSNSENVGDEGGSEDSHQSSDV